MTKLVDNEIEAGDFLDRLDVDVNDFESFSILEAKMNSIFSKANLSPPTNNQIQAVFNVGETQFLDFPNNGIRRVEFQQFGKRQVRFTIKGFKGLFGFSSALNFLNALK